MSRQKPVAKPRPIPQPTYTKQERPEANITLQEAQYYQFRQIPQKIEEKSAFEQAVNARLDNKEEAVTFTFEAKQKFNEVCTLNQHYGNKVTAQQIKSLGYSLPENLVAKQKTKAAIESMNQFLPKFGVQQSPNQSQQMDQGKTYFPTVKTQQKESNKKGDFKVTFINEKIHDVKQREAKRTSESRKFPHYYIPPSDHKFRDEFQYLLNQPLFRLDLGEIPFQKVILSSNEHVNYEHMQKITVSREREDRKKDIGGIWRGMHYPADKKKQINGVPHTEQYLDKEEDREEDPFKPDLIFGKPPFILHFKPGQETV